MFFWKKPKIHLVLGLMGNLIFSVSAFANNPEILKTPLCDVLVLKSNRQTLKRLFPQFKAIPHFADLYVPGANANDLYEAWARTTYQIAPGETAYDIFLHEQMRTNEPCMDLNCGHAQLDDVHQIMVNGYYQQPYWQAELARWQLVDSSYHFLSFEQILDTYGFDQAKGEIRQGSRFYSMLDQVVDKIRAQLLQSGAHITLEHPFIPGWWVIGELIVKREPVKLHLWQEIYLWNTDVNDYRVSIQDEAGNLQGEWHFTEKDAEGEITWLYPATAYGIEIFKYVGMATPLLPIICVINATESFTTVGNKNPNFTEAGIYAFGASGKLIKPAAKLLQPETWGKAMVLNDTYQKVAVESGLIDGAFNLIWSPKPQAKWVDLATPIDSEESWIRDATKLVVSQGLVMYTNARALGKLTEMAREVNPDYWLSPAWARVIGAGVPVVSVGGMSTAEYLRQLQYGANPQSLSWKNIDLGDWLALTADTSLKSAPLSTAMGVLAPLRQGALSFNTALDGSDFIQNIDPNLRNGKGGWDMALAFTRDALDYKGPGDLMMLPISNSLQNTMTSTPMSRIDNPTPAKALMLLPVPKRDSDQRERTSIPLAIAEGDGVTTVELDELSKNPLPKKDDKRLSVEEVHNQRQARQNWQRLANLTEEVLEEHLALNPEDGPFLRRVFAVKPRLVEAYLANPHATNEEILKSVDATEFRDIVKFIASQRGALVNLLKDHRPVDNDPDIVVNWLRSADANRASCERYAALFRARIEPTVISALQSLDQLTGQSTLNLFELYTLLNHYTLANGALKHTKRKLANADEDEIDVLLSTGTIINIAELHLPFDCPIPKVEHLGDYRHQTRYPAIVMLNLLGGDTFGLLDVFPYPEDFGHDHSRYTRHELDHFKGRSEFVEKLNLSAAQRFQLEYTRLRAYQIYMSTAPTITGYDPSFLQAIWVVGFRELTDNYNLDRYILNRLEYVRDEARYWYAKIYPPGKVDIALFLPLEADDEADQSEGALKQIFKCIDQAASELAEDMRTLALAQQVLQDHLPDDQPLTEKERQDILFVHHMCDDEIGADTVSPARLGNYSKLQKQTKYRELRERGFSEEVARLFVDKEVVGRSPEPSMTDFTNLPGPGRWLTVRRPSHPGQFGGRIFTAEQLNGQRALFGTDSEQGTIMEFVGRFPDLADDLGFKDVGDGLEYGDMAEKNGRLEFLKGKGYPTYLRYAPAEEIEASTADPGWIEDAEAFAFARAMAVSKLPYYANGTRHFRFALDWLLPLLRERMKATLSGRFNAGLSVLSSNLLRSNLEIHKKIQREFLFIYKQLNAFKNSLATLIFDYYDLVADQSEISFGDYVLANYKSRSWFKNYVDDLFGRSGKDDIESLLRVANDELSSDETLRLADKLGSASDSKFDLSTEAGRRVFVQEMNALWRLLTIRHPS